MKMSKKLTTSVFVFIASASCLCAAAAGASALSQDQPGQQVVSEKVVPTLTVSGDAELHKPADRLVMALGVTTQSAEAQQAVDQNSRAMQQVVRALKEAGLEDGEYETGHFNLTPVYSYPGRQGGERKITGFQVTNQIVIKSKKLEKAGEWIAVANEAGANEVHSVQFDIAEPRQFRDEAIAEATRYCRSDARVLAEAAGCRIMRVLSITLDQTGYQPLVMRQEMMRVGAAADVSVTPPPMKPGDVIIRANVTIVYEIQDEERN